MNKRNLYQNKLYPYPRHGDSLRVPVFDAWCMLNVFINFSSSLLEGTNFDLKPTKSIKYCTSFTAYKWEKLSLRINLSIYTSMDKNH